MDNIWVYSQPMWWISAIHNACADEGATHCSWSRPGDYLEFTSNSLTDVLRHLGDRPLLKPECVRRALFFAKALKKWRLPIVDNAVTLRAQKAMAGFCTRNCEIGVNQNAYMPVCIDEMRRLLHRWLPYPSSTRALYGKFGPGACAERLTHPQRFSRLTDWLDAGMDPSQPEESFGHIDSDAQGVCRLCAVPKDWDKDRLITVEPCLLTYLQQHVRRLILESIHCGPLRGSAMDLGYTDGQAIQRRLALTASRTHRDATLDLSDASDRISWSAVQAVFPSWVTDLLWQTRSVRFVSKDPVDGTTTSGNMHMFAGMGNATTFPIETLFFSAYVASIQTIHGQKFRVSTFGDDIITDSETAELILSDWVTPFFKVNVAKSFWGGSSLRESCGIFAHSGHDVTVPKIQGYLPSWEGALGVADLHRRLTASGDVFQHLLASAIANEGLLQNWPFLVDGYPSISDWTAEFSALPRSRWNRSYQRSEVRVMVRKPRQRSFSCEDALVERRLANDSELSPRESAIVRRRELDPPARIWYDAVLSGARSTGPAAIARPNQHHRSRVFFPTGKFRSTYAWCCKVGV